jgi:hypothetical protein
MCWSCNKYHYAIRKLEKNADTAKAEILLEASEQNDIDLKEMKKIKDCKSKGQVMPEQVDGETEPDRILDKFKEVYENLYNSSETAEATNSIKEKLSTMIDENSVSEINKITGKLVKKACVKMKPHKMDVSGGYTSDTLLHAP